MGICQRKDSHIPSTMATRGFAALPSILKYVLKRVFEWAFGLALEGEMRIGDDDRVTNGVEDEWGCLGTRRDFAC